jgi:hypothetical protein
LFANELIEGFILVKRGDHIVAIRPDVGDENVPLESIALAEPDDVEPVPPPTFAVVGRGEEPLHYGCVGTVAYAVGISRLRSAGGDKLADFLWRGGKPQQIECDTTNEDPWSR